MEWLLLTLIGLGVVIAGASLATNAQTTHDPPPTELDPVEPDGMSSDDDDPWPSSGITHPRHFMDSSIDRADDSEWLYSSDPYTDPSQACLPGNLWHDSLCEHDNEIGSQGLGINDD